MASRDNLASERSPVLKVSKQVTHRDQPDNDAVFCDHEVSDAILGHQVTCLVRRTIDLNRDQWGAHDASDMLFPSIPAVSHRFSDQIGLTDDPDESSFRAHEQGADSLLPHRQGGFDQGGIRPDGLDVLTHHHRERAQDGLGLRSHVEILLDEPTRAKLYWTVGRLSIRQRQPARHRHDTGQTVSIPSN